jgi:hypothetical protein
MDVMDLYCEDVKWIEVARDRAQYPDFFDYLSVIVREGRHFTN